MTALIDSPYIGTQIEHIKYGKQTQIWLRDIRKQISLVKHIKQSHLSFRLTIFDVPYACILPYLNRITWFLLLMGLIQLIHME